MAEESIAEPIGSVVMVVADIEPATRLFEEGIGLRVVGEERSTTSTIGELWGVADGDFRVRRLARADRRFGCVDLVESRRAAAAIRDPDRAFDFGIFSLNFRTADLDRALERLKALGARPISEPVAYDVGKPMREVLLEIDGGARITLIQVGDPNRTAPLFAEPVATYGVVVPSMDAAQAFYRDVFGLEVAIAFKHSGPPFDAALGIAGDLTMDFATLTARGEWMAKLELLVLEVAGEKPENRSELADFEHTGYSFLTFVAKDLERIGSACGEARAAVIVEPKRFRRPFHGDTRAMIVRAPGGEYLEVIEA
jgi:catechol 2,3-dioxygenase-like lactoylglutathione lyase family enzyme